MLWDFACQMSENIFSGTNTPSTPRSPSSSASEEPLPLHFMTTVLNHTDCVIQFEKWVDGEKEDTKFFARVANREAAYLEVEREVVKETDWVWGWYHIKLRCQHRGIFFVLKMFEKLDETGERKRRVNGGKWKWDMEDEQCGEEREATETREAMGEGALESEDGNMFFDGEEGSGSQNCGVIYET